MKKTKLFFGTVVLLVMLLAFSVVAFAAEKELTSGDYTYVVLSDGSAKITSYKGTAANCVIPSKIGGKTVSTLGGKAILNVNSLKTLVIPGTIHTIEEFGVSSCKNLWKVTIESGKLKSLGRVTIEFCDNLKELNLPDTLVSLSGTFSTIDKLEKINVDSKNPNLKSVDGVVFSKDGKVLIKYPSSKKCELYVIPSSVKTIENSAFYCTNNLDELYIPITVKKMSENTFAYSSAKVLYEGSEAPAGFNNAFDVKEVTYNACCHTYKTTTTKATAKKDGSVVRKCTVCGYVKSNKKIYKLQSATLSGTKFIHNGKNITPSLTVKDSQGNKLVKDRDYSISVQSNRTYIGKYTVTITFKGNYSGTAKRYFTVLPGATSKVAASSVTSSSVKLSWNKVSGAAGYTVYRYSPSKKAYVVAGKTEGTSLTIKGLYSKTEYTFRVKAYGKTPGGKVYNSEQYKAIKITTKPVAEIKLKNTTVTTYVGKVGTLAYTVYPSNATVKWKTSDKSVVSVTADGKMTVLKKGTATITAYIVYKDKTYKSTCKITVKQPTISLSKSEATVYKYNTLTLKATTDPSNAKVKWTTSNSAVAAVNSSGKVTATGKGTATITASFSLNGKTYKKTCKITVKDQKVVSITGVDFGVKNSDDVYISVEVKNNTNRKIEGIVIGVAFGDKNGELLYCNATGNNSWALTAEYAIASKGTKAFYWDSVMQSKKAACVSIYAVSVVLSDGTVITEELDEFWYNDTYVG